MEGRVSSFLPSFHRCLSIMERIPVSPVIQLKTQNTFGDQESFVNLGPKTFNLQKPSASRPTTSRVATRVVDVQDHREGLNALDQPPVSSVMSLFSEHATVLTDVGL
jgi:hypothetical protein